jgi:hypothetical protein
MGWFILARLCRSSYRTMSGLFIHPQKTFAFGGGLEEFDTV